jgi:hypothetical protein
MTWAVFKDGKQISKAHRAKHAAVIEAFELGCIVSCEDRNVLATSCEIKEVRA